MLSLGYIVLRFLSSAVHPATDDALDSADCDVKVLAASVFSTTQERSTSEQVLVNEYIKCTHRE